MKLKASKKPAIAAEHDRTIAIYNKAAEIFHERGFDATSMSDIASAVDLTKAGLYYYVESKEDLLFTIISFAMEQLETRVIEPSRAIASPQERLLNIVTRHARLLTEGNKAITILTDEIDGLKPRHRRQILDRKRAYLDLVRGTLDALRRRENCATSTRPWPRSACLAIAMAAALVSHRWPVVTRRSRGASRQGRHRRTLEGEKIAIQAHEHHCLSETDSRSRGSGPRFSRG